MSDIETPNKEVGKDKISRVGMAQEEAMAASYIDSRVEVTEQFWWQRVTYHPWYLGHIVKADFLLAAYSSLADIHPTVKPPFNSLEDDSQGNNT